MLPILDFPVVAFYLFAVAYMLNNVTSASCLTYTTIYVSFLLIILKMYIQCEYHIEKKLPSYRIFSSFLIFALTAYDIIVQNMYLVWFISLTILFVWGNYGRFESVHIAMNRIQETMAIRYLCAQLLLAYHDRTLDVILAISFIISFLANNDIYPTKSGCRILTLSLETLTAVYVLMCCQNNLLSLAVIINYVLIFTMLTKESCDITNVLLFWNISTVMYAIIFAQLDFWIPMYNIAYVILVITKYNEMRASKFEELVLWCKNMNFSPYVIYKTSFSLLVYLLLNHRRENKIPYFFISDKNRPKKYIHFSYDHGNQIIIDKTLMIKCSKRCQQIELNPIGAMLLSRGMLCIKNIFTFKIFKLMRILANAHTDITYTISEWYVLLIRQKIDNVNYLTSY
jgi:hypothetical protein